MKSTYVLRINGGVKTNASNSYIFNYGRTKDICLACVKEKAQMEFELGKDYFDIFSNSYCENLIKEGIKRVFLVHILKYKNCLKIKRIELVITCGELVHEMDLTEKLIMYSMIPIAYSFDQKLGVNDASFISNLLKRKKTEMGANLSSLYAYIYSKCQTFEIEKFMYLWMAFNGYYKYKYNKKLDADGIKECLKDHNLGTEIFSRARHETQGLKVMAHLSSLSKHDIELLMLETSNSCKEFKEKYLRKDDNDGAQLDITVKGYLMMDFAYYLRCSVFHANKPLPLFAYEKDMELIAVIIVNKLLEDFMDNHILELF